MVTSGREYEGGLFKNTYTKVTTQKVSGSRHLETRYNQYLSNTPKNTKRWTNFIVISPETTTILEFIPDITTSDES